MRHSLEEVLSGMLASVSLESFTDDADKLGAIFKNLSQDHPMLAPFAAVGGESDFSAHLRDALQKLVDRKMLEHQQGRYVLTVQGRAANVRSKQTLFNRSDVAELETAARDFDARLKSQS